MPVEVQLPTLQKGVEPVQELFSKAMGVEGQEAEVPVHFVTFLIIWLELLQYQEELIEHVVAVLLKAFAGQALLLPSQDSAESHAPAELLQTAVDFESIGQEAEVPVQYSVISQSPAEFLHTVDEGLKTLAGQDAEEPVQYSAGSHAPAEERHSAEESLNLPVESQQSPELHCFATHMPFEQIYPEKH
jgi:hypothetical protein